MTAEAKTSERASASLPKLSNTPAATAVGAVAAVPPSAPLPANGGPPPAVNSTTPPPAIATTTAKVGVAESALQGRRRASSGGWAPGRVNPLQPEPPKRRTVALETEDPHFHNWTRTLNMQTRQYHGRQKLHLSICWVFQSVSLLPIVLVYR